MIDKTEMTRTAQLFNLYAKAHGMDVKEFEHQAKKLELERQGITEEAKPLLKRLSELTLENKKLKERKEDHNEKQHTNSHN